MMKKAQPKVKRAKLPLSVKFSIFCVMVMMVVFFQDTVLLVGCLVPTFVAGLIDNGQSRTAWVTVGSMNLAGSIPAWFELWEKGHTINIALELITKPQTLAIAYGAAGLGWVIYYNVTPIVATIMAVKGEKRLKEIAKRQKELTEKWGAQLTE